MKKVISMVLAGGKGERLYPLTRDRAKPAVPFGGIYRIIDFTLSNCVNSGFRRTYILTQYKSLSLDRHIQMGWNFLSNRMGEFIHVLPAQQRVDENWYRGTADAIFQNIYTLQQERPDLVLVLSGDHIYKMDYRNLINYHIEMNADLTIATFETDKKLSKQFGVLEVNNHNRITGFQEKPSHPKTSPNNPDTIIINMGVYVFNTEILVKRVIEDAKNKDTQHDFGKNIIPAMLKKDRVFSYRFIDHKTGKPGYWRDVGSIDAYWEASMDLLKPRIECECDIYDNEWPIFTYERIGAPAKVEGSGKKKGIVFGTALNSVISQGCIISKSRIERSILSPNVTVNEYSMVSDSILMNGVTIGRNCLIQRAIIDKRVNIPDGTEIGYNPKKDAKNFTVSDSGIVVLPRRTIL